ncbi:DNA primase [Candidatus Methylobacter oryzae]|uniref:DNA primase n=1 Tax=Candidatus Methylobacter oryzae TaxID=2497749 RepID=A0ABY3CHJ8_9GAMM|nr:DNA primase [Candidatus Methylobacter oryzae]TRX03623.1 DNA primase [Candidatus Methylobacter oryzae]
MSGRIPREFIDDLLVRVDIVDLIDSHVPLKKTGNNFVARCPFHAEKTPSFSVNRKKQFFHCFGCGASGNAISFLMEFSHLDFVEAVEDLAAFVGIDVPRESVEYQSSKQKKEDSSELYALMEQVAGFYVERLRSGVEGKIAAEYLKNRGVGGASASDFMLGYAPDEWQALTARFDSKLLLEAGLVVIKEGGQIYDRFRGRIMFPIRDRRARIIGFGGRVLDNSLPKYLNSPETSLFHKSREVYGLYELLAKNAKPQRILIVEGYMDVIALAQYGIHYAVATLGTAASQAHLDLLFRFCSELVFCFDGDKAGREAAWRAMEPAFSSLKDGRQIRIMLLPPNHDPDSLVREEDVDGFVGRVQAAETLSDYFFGHFSNELNLSEIEGRAQLVSKARPYLEKLPESIFREMMFARLKELSGWANLDVFENAATLASNQGLKQVRKADRNLSQDGNRLSSARVAVALLVQNPRLAELVEQREIDWNGLDFPGAGLFRSILQTIADKNPVNAAVLVECYRDAAEEKSIKALALLDSQVSDDKIDAVFCDSLDRLLNQARESALTRLLNKGKTNGLDAQEKELLRKMLATKIMVPSSRNL